MLLFRTGRGVRLAHPGKRRSGSDLTVGLESFSSKWCVRGRPAQIQLRVQMRRSHAGLGISMPDSTGYQNRNPATAAIAMA